MEGDEPDGPPRGHRIAPPDGGGEGLDDHPLLGDQLLQAAAGEVGVHAQQPSRLGDQLRLGQIAMTILAGLRQRELQAGLDPLGAVVGDAEALGDLVRGLEPNPPHLGGQPVRLAPDTSIASSW